MLIQSFPICYFTICHFARRFRQLCLPNSFTHLSSLMSSSPPFCDIELFLPHISRTFYAILLTDYLGTFYDTLRHSIAFFAVLGSVMSSLWLHFALWPSRTFLLFLSLSLVFPMVLALSLTVYKPPVVAKSTLMFDFLSTRLNLVIPWEYYLFYLLLIIWALAGWFGHLLVIKITCRY